MNVVKQIEIKLDQKCPICGDRMVNDQGQLTKQMSIISDIIGPAHDECYFPYLEEHKIRILCKIRCYSIGDVISATPLMREIKRIYPKCHLGVMTMYPDLWKYNPHVDSIIDMNETITEDMIKFYHFQLDAFNEQKICGHFVMHSVPYITLCGIDKILPISQWEYEVNYIDSDREHVEQVLKKNGVTGIDKLIVINPHGTEWPTRDWGPKHFHELVHKLRIKYPDYKFISFGGKRSETQLHKMNNYVYIPNVIDLYGEFSLLQSIALCDHPQVKLVITPDTGSLHVAACAREVPILGIFTLIRSEYRTPVRNGQLGYKFIGINSDDPCSCTSNARFMTNSAVFKECPLKTFLENTRKLDVPPVFKIHGLTNLFPEVPWNEQQVNLQCEHKLKEFERLKCFPTVDKVIKAVETMINSYG